MGRKEIKAPAKKNKQVKVEMKKTKNVLKQDNVSKYWRTKIITRRETYTQIYPTSYKATYLLLYPPLMHIIH